MILAPVRREARSELYLVVLTEWICCNLPLTKYI
jgi:hypothetical protein